MKKIWIDLENSPHVLFFNPIIKQLEHKGYRVLVTARDYAQVVGLVNLYHINAKIIGRHHGKNKFLKIYGLLSRAFQLFFIAKKEKPDIAVSHYSRSQLLASKISAIPSAIAYDYEYVQNLIFIKPNLYLIPEVLYKNTVLKQNKNFSFYPGIKENVYMQRSNTNQSILKRFNINENDVIITIRPPASEAHYHNNRSSLLFEMILNFLTKIKGTKIIILPRTKKQKLEIQSKWIKFIKNSNILIPDIVLDGNEIINISDLVISGGGTMIREAAAINVPAYSFFCGKTGEVDKHLIDNGKLKMIRSLNDINKNLLCVKKEINYDFLNSDNSTINSIVNQFIDLANKNS